MYWVGRGVTKLPMITICLILCTSTILLGNKYYFMQSLCNAITKHVNEYNFFFIQRFTYHDNILRYLYYKVLTHFIFTNYIIMSYLYIKKTILIISVFHI